ncbi:hypothetical protein B7P43_G14139 [Cryptotermes secundus]|uniref:G patch domain-containing protein 4 n=2 Tax=Cryptotermes secundus TaxID=105785 RepID=A0A2J7Q2T1_9NEOP|nr:G patch domain-containing protein 4 [Cryptotermes secundus]PNF22890.1 hypothetical protein B7P43_G14139 [Cryptotermes secundus]
MDFARNQLVKYGWKEGKGLGRNESGITEALKPKLKFDTRGVGHDASEQFTYHWWEHAFNKAAKNIQVSSTEDGVDVKLQQESVAINTTKYAVKTVKNPLEYGTFLKTSTLTQGQVVRITENILEVPEQKDPVANAQSLTDDDLFRICGGRTAHKGARHGLKLNGKLARIEEQEKQLLACTKEGKKKILKQNRVNLTDSDDISSSQDQSRHKYNKFLQPEEVEKEIKKKKKSKRPDKEDSAQTINIQISHLQSEFLHSAINKTHNGVTKSEKVNLCSAATVGTRNVAPTNQLNTPGNECAVFRKEKKYKKPRSETEDHKLCEGMENMKQEHQNMPSLGNGAKKRKQKKWKGIPSKVTSTEETQMVDIAHEEYFASYSKKKKKIV